MKLSPLRILEFRVMCSCTPNKLYHVYTLLYAQKRKKTFFFDWLKKVATDTSINTKLKSVITTDPLINYRFS